VRGLHLQHAPFAQAKLFWVTRGAIIDVAVDLRRPSPTFLHHVCVELNAKKGTQIYIPPGFAHGYAALEDATEVQYKVSADHSPEHELVLHWRDADLNIPWPIGEDEAILSEKDRRGLPLARILSRLEEIA
jgi:dTDP-4-dehydrorhamnose 3,5-epimerase